MRYHINYASLSTKFLLSLALAVSSHAFIAISVASAETASAETETKYDWGAGFQRAGKELKEKVMRGAIDSAVSDHDPNLIEIGPQPGNQLPGTVSKAASPEFMKVVPVQSRPEKNAKTAPSRPNPAVTNRDQAGIQQRTGPEKAKDTTIGKDQTQANTPTNDSTAKDNQAKPTIIDGTDTDDAIDDGSTEINVKNAEIEAVIRIFSKKTKRNFILDEKVKGRVSIFLPGRISPDESVRILDSVLALKGFTAVPIGENLWKIVPSKEARQSTIPTQLGSDSAKPTATMVTRLLQLKYISPDDIKQMIAPLVSGDGLLNTYAGTNSLILIDQEDNIERLVKIIDSLDVPFSDREMTIIPIQYADATELAQRLQEILGEPKQDKASGAEGSLDLLRARLRNAAVNSNAARSPTGAVSALSNAMGDSGIAARSREPKIIPDQRTNSIIVVADEDMTARIRALLSQLDSKVDLSGNRFYVYRCQHAKADDLANVLSGLVGGDSSSGSRNSGRFGDTDGGSSMSGSRSGSNSRNINSSSGGSGGIGSQSPSQSRGQSSSRSAGTVSLGDNLSITADPATNSLIISAGKTDYQKILALLEKLDIKRRQVLVEAMLLEVGIDDQTTFGTEFMVSGGGADGGILAKSDFGGLSQLLADPTKLSNFSVAAASSGSLTLGDNITIPSQTVLLQAAQRNSNVNVLSAPNVLATDNEQAEIVVGQNVPFLASTSTSDTNLNNTFNQVDRQDVGITLRITPQISSNDFVNLKIFTEVSNVILVTVNSSLGPTTTKRASETTVIAKDSQMVVIGGLMSDDVTETRNGVPFLQDIPVFGSLFRSTSENHRRTNLLIFITPRIIRDQFDARDLTIDGRDRMEHEIDTLQTQPDRDDVLRRRSIDRVAESSPVLDEEEEKPGTEATSRHGTSGVPAAAPTPAAVRSFDLSGTDGPINLSIEPKIPKLIENSSEHTAPNSEPRARLSTSRLSSVAKPKLGDRFIVLKLGDLRPGELELLAPNLPFGRAVSNDQVGIVVSADSSRAARDFFQAGSVYTYRAEGRDLKLQVSGVFDSPQDSGLTADWYTLSPYEVMAITSPSGSSAAGSWQRSK